MRRLWSTALAGMVDIGYIKATGQSVKIYLPKTDDQAGSGIRMEDSEVEQRHRTRSRAHLLPGLRGGRRAPLRRKSAWPNCMPAGRKTWTDFKVPEEAIGCGFHEAVRGVLSHHVVIRDGKIANYHPYPPTPWNASPRDILRHARGRTRTPCRIRRSSKRTGRRISRASTSCAPSAASIRACPAASTCIWAMARYSKPAICRCSEHRDRTRPRPPLWNISRKLSD